MTNLFQAAFLGIIQGLTEFLPISSSGHLIVLPQIFHWQGVVNSLDFDVAAHLGTAAALIVFFWRDWVRLIFSFLAQIPRGWRGISGDLEAKLLALIVVGSIPAGVVGVLFDKVIETTLRSVLLVGITTTIFGVLLWWVDQKAAKVKKITSVGWLDSIIVGTAQAVALVPGVSRSGITITAARLQKLERAAAVRFSFLLSTPAVLGAGLLTAKDLVGAKANVSIFLVGFIFATISGYLAIKFLLAFVQKNNFNIFVVYRIAFGIFLVFWTFLRGVF
jgi:undecaprenyl-diphosphatase